MTDSTLDRLRSALADRYEILREVGSGGMATVYLATDIRHQRKVALKVLRHELSATLGPERFLQEVRVTANLQHPHILPLFDSGEAGGFLYFVMPFVDGESLREKLVRGGELPVPEAARLLRDVVDALAAAHALGIVHRDIKPENIMLLGRHAMVTDFGVAKAVSEATGRHKLTTVGVALGTPAYMAPEQAAADEHIDHRADIYAVGAVAYELLTGKPPFTGRTPQQVLAAQVTEKPARVTERRSAVPPGLETLVMKCLEKKPADRWQKAEEMLPHLEAFATPSGGMTPTQMIPVAAKRTAPKWARAGLGLGVLATAALGIWFGWPALTARFNSRAADAVAIDPSLFAVLPFRVSVTDPSLMYLREGMVDLLHVKLSSIRRSVEPRTLLAAWRSAGGGEADPSLEAVVRMAEGLSAGRVLLGSLVGSPEQLTLSASLYEVPRGEELATASVSGPAADLPSLIDKLSVEILSLEAGQGEDRLETLTTTSLPALRAYLDGMSLYRRGFYRESTQSFVEAVEIDSTFALAALYMGDAAGMATGAFPAAARARAIVDANRDRLGPSDRAYSLVRYPPSGNTRTPLERYESAIDQLRDRPEAWYNYADVLFHQGAAYGIPNFLSRAKDGFSRALALDSANFNPLHHLVWIALAEGDTAFAARVMRERLASEPNGLIATEFRISLAALAGDTAEIRRLIPALDTLPEEMLIGTSMAPNSVQFTYFAISNPEKPWPGWDPARAWRALDLVFGRATTPSLRAAAFARRYQLALNFGRPREAEEILVAGAASAPTLATSADAERIHSAVYWDGDSAAAARAAQRLAALPTPNPADRYALATWRLSRGETTGVQESIGTLRTAGAPPTDSLRALILETRLADITNDARAESLTLALDAATRNSFPLWQIRAQGNLTVAHLFEERGDLTRALAATRRVLQTTTPDADRYASTLLREQGRLAAALGLREDAILAYSGFLQLRYQPEPDAQAEAERIRGEIEALKAGRRSPQGRP